MERLTKRREDGTAWYNHQPEKSVSNDELLSRLAAYEDTGLTPEEIRGQPSYTTLLINKEVTDAEWEEIKRIMKQPPGTVRVCLGNKVDVCVCCGAIIPEGRHICYACEMRVGL